MSKCCLPGCDRPLLPHSKLKTCQRYRNSMGVAIKKGFHWYVNRTRDLKLYLARTENIHGGKRRVW